MVAIKSAGTVLSNFKGCSKVMVRYPITKTNIIIAIIVIYNKIKVANYKNKIILNRLFIYLKII